MMPKHPGIIVKLVGTDGNAFAVLGAVGRALRQAGIPTQERDKFMSEATNGDYNELLATCMKWVTVR